MRFQVLFFLLLAGFSCRHDRIREIEQNVLFSLGLGRMEDELDFFEVFDNSVISKTRVFMRDGLFFIASGKASKIMQLSSYGDLISLIYNPQENPVPVLLDIVDDNPHLSSRRAVKFPFMEIGEIAVDSRRTILIEDQVSASRMEYDHELGVRLNRIVRRFDRHGRPLEYIGQEGVRGRPFPFIKNIIVNKNDEITVTCVASDRWLVFRYTAEGRLMHEFEMDLNALPALSTVTDLIPSLGSLIPDPEEPLLYAKIDYYNKPSIAGSDGSFFGSYIYWINLHTGNFEGFIEIPRTIEQEMLPGIGTDRRQPDVYQILGMVQTGIFFLITPRSDNQNQVLIMDRYGKVLHYFTIYIEEKDLFYRDFYLTPEGVLVGLLCRRDRVDFVWWRFDRYIQGYVSENP